MLNFTITRKFIKRNPDLSEEQAFESKKKTTKPERGFIEKEMSNQQGLLVIHLFDTGEVFRINDKQDEKVLIIIMI
jgi:hypothetical protein